MKEKTKEKNASIAEKEFEAIKEMTDKRDMVSADTRRNFVQKMVTLFKAMGFVIVHQGGRKTSGDVKFYKVHQTTRNLKIEFLTKDATRNCDEVFPRLRKISKAFQRISKHVFVFDIKYFGEVDVTSRPKSILQKMDMNSDTFIIPGESSRDFGIRIREYVKLHGIKKFTIRENLDPTDPYRKRFQVDDGPLAVALLGRFKDLHAIHSKKGLKRMVTVCPKIDSNRGRILSEAVIASEIIEFLSLAGEDKSKMVMDFISVFKTANESIEKLKEKDKMISDLERKISAGADLRDAYLNLTKAGFGIYKEGGVNKIGMEKFLKICK